MFEPSLVRRIVLRSWTLSGKPTFCLVTGGSRVRKGSKSGHYKHNNYLAYSVLQTVLGRTSSSSLLGESAKQEKGETETTVHWEKGTTKGETCLRERSAGATEATQTQLPENIRRPNPEERGCKRNSTAHKETPRQCSEREIKLFQPRNKN